LPDLDLHRYYPSVCPTCESVGTIVDMGLCCTVQAWMLMGALWEFERDLGAGPAPRLRYRRINGHARPPATKSPSEET
jgi:hypothetical protein